jgi:hypothetical protein
MESNCQSSHIKIKLEFSRQIFEKFPNIKFTINCPLRKKLLNVDGQTERRTDTMTLKVALHSFDHDLNYGLKNSTMAAKVFLSQPKVVLRRTGSLRHTGSVTTKRIHRQPNGRHNCSKI